MELLLDIFSYVIATGCVFAAVCAMTRGGRGWTWRLVALGVLIAVNAVKEALWRCGQMPLDSRLAVSFVGECLVFIALILGLSRDSFGRRLFLSIVYSGYAVCFAVFYHLLAYRNVFGLSDVGSAMAAAGAVVLLNLVFLCWILPLMPRDDGHASRWGESCIAAGAVAVLLFASGIWPISIVTAPVRYCSAFAVAAVVAWAVFPVLCRQRNERVRMAAAEQSVALLTAEMRERRAAIDEARRLRHDRRFDRVQIGEYLLRGQYDRAQAYLAGLDDAAAETPTDTLVWCENETVNAILSGAARKAAAKGVAFVAEAAVEKALPLSDVDLVAVFANVIDNALAAAAEVRGLRSEVRGLRSEVRGQRSNSGVSISSAGQHNDNLHSLTSDLGPLTFSQQVTCTIRQRENGIGLAVTNPVPEGFALSAEGLPCDVPGIGLESVRRVVERQRGQWLYTLADGVLKCQVMLRFGE